MDTNTLSQESALMLIPKDVLNGFVNELNRYDKIQRINAQTGETVSDEFKSGEFKGKRFPGTVTTERIDFNEELGAYNIGKYLLPENKTELERLVSEIGLTYEDGPNKGQLITITNPRNRRDPFFSNYNLKLKTEEGYYVFNPNKALDLLFIENFKNSNRVDVTNTAEGGNSETVYFLVELDYERKKEIQKSIKKLDVIKKFMVLNPSQKQKIAFILKENVDMNTDMEHLSSILFRKIDNPVQLVGNRDTMDEIDELMNLPDDQLTLRSYISRGLSNRLIELRSNYYYFNNTSIGKTPDDILMYFNDYKNNEEYHLLQKECNKIFLIDEPVTKKPKTEKVAERFDFDNLPDEKV